MRPAAQFCFVLFLFRFLLLASDHTTIIEGECPEPERETVIRIVEAQEELLAKTLQTEFGIPLRIVFCRDLADFRNRTGARIWHGGQYSHGIITLQRLTVLQEQGILETTLRHEVAHAMLESLAGPKAPRWLMEGLAVILSEDLSLMAADASQACSFSRLEEELHSSDRGRVQAAYSRLAINARNLVDHCGWLRLHQALSALHRGVDTPLQTMLGECGMLEFYSRPPGG